MARWSKSLGNSVNFAAEKMSGDGFLKDFFEKRIFVPSNEEEQREYDEFCFVSSAMSLAVYVSLADGETTPSEKERIVTEMILQLAQRRHEYEELSGEYGSSDKVIIDSLFERIREEMLAGTYKLDEVIRVINMLFERNPFKKNYLLRLSYIVGYADKTLNESTRKTIEDIAQRLGIEESERERIRKEVKTDFRR